MNFPCVIIFTAFAIQVRSDKCTTPNKEQGECIALNSCSVLAAVKNDASAEEFITRSICGGSRFSPMVCCGSSSNFVTPKTNQNISKKKLLPDKRYCGYQHSDDYFREENDTSIRITEFPWLARIKHRSKVNAEEEETFRCSGSLISTRYVLTAAFCVVNPKYIPVGVRLGEYHVKNETDCVQEPPFDEECSSDVEDFDIDKVIPHPYYHPRTYANAIALIRLNRTVIYTDYIRPICLPLPGTKFADAGDILLTSGWGVSHADAEGKKVEIKKKIFSKLITNEECVTTLMAKDAEVEARKITENFMCTLQQLSNSTDLECLGDTGGPVMFSQRLQWHQEGITAYGRNCRFLDYPRIQVKVEKYVKWIEDNVEP